MPVSKGFRGLPAQVTFDLAGINRVTAIVTRAVCHIGDQAGIAAFPAGLEFVEFASPVANTLEPLFEKMGFTLVAQHRSKDVVLYRQGDINFIVNREPKSLPVTLLPSTALALVPWRFE